MNIYRYIKSWFSSTKLKVPYIRQINENACGVAVLEMVYKYYGLQDISQQEIMQKYQELEPHGTGNFRITTDNLVSDALSRFFLSFWARADFRNNKNVNQLLTLLINSKIPIIVCQKFTNEQPQLGHFRIVVGIMDNIIFLHDPHQTSGAAYQEWNMEDFLNFWQPTGDNVTGGIFIVIKKL